MADDVLITLGPASTRIGGGVQYHHLDRLARRGAIPFVLSSRIRLVRVRDLAVIREACREAGF